jgi:hypothetical protein
MEREQFEAVRQSACCHAKYKSYSQRKFDILNGFEMIEARCLNCHKILEIQINKFDLVSKCKVTE